MRAFLLTAVALLAFAGGMFAQNLPPDYLWEVGINGGYSFNTRPLGPANAYQGTRTQKVHDYSIHLNYYVTQHWMLNLDIGERKWESYGTWQLNDKFGQPLKPRNISFLQADHAINESVAFNYVIPFYTRYNTFNLTNVFKDNAGPPITPISVGICLTGL